MKVSYLLPIPRPARPELDAAVQGAQRLGERFPGPLVYLYPGDHYRSGVPRWLCGAGRAEELRRLDCEVDLHVLFSDKLRPYPFLGRLKKPLVYTLMTGLATARRPFVGPRLGRGWRLVVSNQQDSELLERWGHRDVAVIPPGLDLDRFTRVPAPEGPGFVLLAGSAPWTKRQFRTKGVDLLLQVARTMPDLRLVFLWRGTLEEEIVRRVARLGLAERVEIIGEHADVDRVLSRVHAATVLARSAKLVKAFPHSLIEALAAGKPVIVSRDLAISRFVEQHGCGEVVNELAQEDLLAAVGRLRKHYFERRERTLRAPLQQFSLDTYLEAYRAIFRDTRAPSGA